MTRGAFGWLIRLRYRLPSSASISSSLSPDDASAVADRLLKPKVADSTHITQNASVPRRNWVGSRHGLLSQLLLHLYRPLDSQTPLDPYRQSCLLLECIATLLVPSRAEHALDSHKSACLECEAEGCTVSAPCCHLSIHVHSS
jgi:hypothetical protein